MSGRPSIDFRLKTQSMPVQRGIFQRYFSTELASSTHIRVTLSFSSPLRAGLRTEVFPLPGLPEFFDDGQRSQPPQSARTREVRRMIRGVLIRLSMEGSGGVSCFQLTMRDPPLQPDGDDCCGNDDQNSAFNSFNCFN